MTTINIYLNFKGNCEEVFLFYKSIFGGDFESINRYKEMPHDASPEPIPESLDEKIMHISLPISKETVLMGSDVGGQWSNSFKQGNNFTISVNTDNEYEATRIFNSLAEGGKINMPLAKTFWQAYFGMLTDKFGINWMINCNLPSHKNYEKNHEI